MNKIFSDRTRPLRRRAAALLALAVVCGTPVRPAFAQPRSGADIAEARQLFNEGVRLRDHGDLPGAIKKLRGAHALGNTPITGLELGKALLAAGNFVDARETFLSVARIEAQPAETSRSKVARDESARLADQVRARIASITIRVTGVPADTVAVSVDGALIPTEALAAARLVDPGTHQVLARSTSGGTAEKTIELAEGESRDVDLRIAFVTTAPSVSQLEAHPAPPAAVESASGAVTTPARVAPLVYVGFGVAAAGIGVGTVTGILSISKASWVKGQCVSNDCPTSVDGNLRAGRTLGDISTIAFAAAGAGAVVGVLSLVFTGHAEPRAASPRGPVFAVRPWILPGSAGLSGSF